MASGTAAADIMEPTAMADACNQQPRLEPTAPPPPLKETQLPTLFGEVLETSVTFCVDTSGSMYSCLHVVQKHLVESLQKHANRDQDTMFNIIEFNTEVTQWADKMVKCTPETVEVATEWINKLSAKTGTNTQDALLTAFSDPQCRAVYIVSDGLPDQNPEDILDLVVSECHNRPVHCIYLATGKADEAATEFMEDLAVETFGSFHIVTLTNHGCVERISPVHRSDLAQERLIRTVQNTLHPRVKTCSVGTRLVADPEETLSLMPRVSALSLWPYAPYYYPFPGPFPYRYYYPHYWSRYHTSKAWLKMQDSLNCPPELSPAAGALLIGKIVMARRLDDGYFYKGTIQSQIMSDKFLVAFGPCKHGMYKDTSYQDTFIFDIIDYTDAKRHTVLTGDRVLSPWEAEGERYGPGIVIDGHERRDSQGPDDEQLTVTFSNGKTEKVASDLAMWIPDPVYERLALELKMPREARATLQSQKDYPEESLSGYPGSGPVAKPHDFPRSEPVILESDRVFVDTGRYRFMPTYPVIIQSQDKKTKAAVKSEDINATIPGTNLTRKELEAKVNSQLNERKLITEEQDDEQETKKLLKKRHKQTENTLRKSVSFNDADLVREAYINDVQVEDFDLGDADSGYATSPDLGEERGRMENSEREEYIRNRLSEKYKKGKLEYEFDGQKERDIGVNTDSSLLFRKSRGVGRRPRWKYWKRDPSPNMSMKTSHGPFRETALQAPLEARDQRNVATNSVEWSSPMFKYVDSHSKHDYSNSVELLLQSCPAVSGSKSEEVQRFGAAVANSLGYDSIHEDRETAAREYRRRQAIKRESEWQARLAEESKMKQLMLDEHHRQILEQLGAERDRQVKEHEVIMQQREAKKRMSRELRTHMEAKHKDQIVREEERIAARRRRREQREETDAHRAQDREAIQERRQQVKVQRCQARADATAAQLDEEQARNMAQANRTQSAKLARIQHFHQLEAQAQKNKDLRVSVSNQQQAMLKSQIFP